MADHTHPEYERNFDRIAVLLDKIVDTQQKVVDTQQKVFEAQLRQEQAHEALQRAHESFQKTVEKAMERLTLKGAETEDKLNALIDLMDRHQREHGLQ